MGDAMAEPSLELDPYLDDEDRRLVADVGADAAPQSGDGPDPADLDEIAPIGVAPSVAPRVDIGGSVDAVSGGAAETVPGTVTLADPAAQAVPALPGAAPTDPTASIAGRTGAAEDLAKRQGVLDTERAQAEAAQAGQRAEIQRQADDDARLAHADYLERRQAAEKALDQKIAALEKVALAGPPGRPKGAKAMLSVIFGGLGAAFRSAGGGDSTNRGVEQLRKQWEDEAALYKANVAALKDSAIMARTRLGDVDEGRRELQRAADASLISKYNAALRQGEAQLKNQGVPRAQLATDARLLELRAGRDAALRQARADEDAHALNKARIESLNARAIRDARKGKGGGGGGGAGGGGAPSVKEQAKRAELSSKIDGMVQKVIMNTGYKESVVQNQKYNQMAASLAGAKDNAALAAAGAGQFVKMAQGGTGVISDNDMKQFWGRIGGIPERVENWIETALTGKMGADKQAIVADAVRELAKAARRELEGIGGQIQTRLQGEAQDIPWVASRIPVYLDTYVPGLRAKQEGAAQAKDGAPAKAGAFVAGQTRKLANGQTVRITSADGDYVVISNGRR